MKIEKDWKGNGKTMVCLGVHNYSGHDRQEHDLYCTDPNAINYLFKHHHFSQKIREPSAGLGHLTNRMIELGKDVYSTDLIERNIEGIKGGVDFLQNQDKFDGDIITNPPYSFAKEFIEKSLEAVTDGHQVAMFLRVQFLESKGRYELRKNNPPYKILVFSGRMACAMNGDFKAHSGSAVPYTRFIWKKGYKGFTTIDRILVDGKI